MKRLIILIILMGFLFEGKVLASSVQDQKAMTILAIGDSTTAGTPGFRSPAEAPPKGSGDEKSQYAYWMMQKHPEWRVINRGINGQRSDEILERFEKELDVFNPQAVIALAGVNDLYQGYSAESVKLNLTKMIDIAGRRKLKLIICTILPYNSASDSVRRRITDVNQRILSFGPDAGFGVCDTFKIVNDPENPFHLRSSPDGLHPSVDGYRQMGEALADLITVCDSAAETNLNRRLLVQNVHSFTIKTIAGNEKSLADYKGKALLLVNTASRCGFTPQYKSMEELYQKYKDRGFEILAFPANNFMNQEPGGDKEIQELCSLKFHTTFPLFSKISVRGGDIHPLYKYLTTESGFDGPIKWNFNKFLVNAEGYVAARFDSSTDPMSAKLVQELDKALPVLSPRKV